MSISLSKYVDITSGVGAGAVVPTRELVLRAFTANSLLPPQNFITFTDASDVGTYFGFTSEEYYRALFYFSFVSKNQTSPESMQFARWVNVAAAPMIFPIQNNNTLIGSWTSISTGSFVLTMGGFTFTLTGLDFTAASTLNDVATDIQTAIRAQSGGGAMWTSATVNYVTTTANGISYNGFELVGGATGSVSNPIVVSVGGGGIDITGIGFLGWVPEQVNVNGALIPGAIWSTGSAVETITATLTDSADASNNFGSFLFLNNLNLTISQVQQAANWNHNENVAYMFLQDVIPANVSTWASPQPAGVGDIGGVGLTVTSPTTSQIGTVTSASPTVTGLQSTAGLLVGQVVSGTNIPLGTVIAAIINATSLTLSANATGTATETITFNPVQFPEQFPAMILAATDYTAINAVQNYEFQQVGGLTPSVTGDSTSDAYDALSVNYYGQTQQAGQGISFYQQGVLMGGITDILDMGAYANEMWLKDAAAASIMTLLLSLSQLSANAQGQSQILGTVMGVVNQALNNGTISVGKALTNAQQAFITQETGDPTAWYQVQNAGYWVSVLIVGSGSPVTYEAFYTLIYSKDDVIRKVDGIHTLI